MSLEPIPAVSALKNGRTQIESLEFVVRHGMLCSKLEVEVVLELVAAHSTKMHVVFIF